MPKWTAHFNKAEDTVLGITVPLFSLVGSHGSCYFTWLHPPRASLPTFSDVSCPPLWHTAWQEKLDWTTPVFFIILQDMGESMPSYQNLKAAARTVNKDCSLKKKISLPHSQAQTEQEFRWGFQARPLFFPQMSFQDQFILTPLHAKLWGAFIVNSNCKLHDKISLSIVMESFIIINLSIGRKGKKTRKSHDLIVATDLGKNYNPKCTPSTTCLSKPNKTSRKWEVSWQFSICI